MSAGGDNDLREAAQAILGELEAEDERAAIASVENEAEVRLPPNDPLPPIEAYASDDPLCGTAKVNGADVVAAPDVNDFFAYMPTHQYMFVRSRDLWPGSSVNVKCTPPCNANGEPVTKQVRHEGKGGVVTWKTVPMSATEFLDSFRTVEQMTWAPGERMLVRDRLVMGGGWIDHPGCNCFNLYQPPRPLFGDSSAAQPWLDHIRKVFPDHVDHIVNWLAHRVQRPGEKINHALVAGGLQGIGKDSVLEPLRYAVGPWNFVEVSPAQLLGRFNGFLKSVILRISEARDLGEADRYAFYEHLKAYTAAPPEVLRCDEKHLREHNIMNVCGVVITTNHKTDGIYLPADDRRHYVAWSELTQKDFPGDYWRKLYGWYRHQGGIGHVAAYLAAKDLSGFDPKAPPPKTPAFWSIVDANRAPEDAELADALEALGNPPAITLSDILSYAIEDNFREWLLDRRNRRQIPHRLEAVGYVAVRNDAADDGLWKVAGKRQVIYARKELSVRDRIAAATRRTRDGRQ